MTLRLISACILVFAATSWGGAQVTTPEFRGSLPDRKDWGTLHMETKIGSFKLLDGSGKVDFTFRGTVMINAGKDATIQVTGSVKKNFERGTRVTYFGQGRVVVVGKWRSIQWFGRDMKAQWYGAGAARISSQFYPGADGKPRTGEWWYDAKERNFMIADGTMTILLPAPEIRSSPSGPSEVIPRERKSG